MNWKASPPAIEIAAASIAAVCLGGAVGFAMARLAPFGTGLIEASVAGALAALAGGLLIARTDRQRGSHRSFAPESLGDLLITEDVLLLDDRVDGEDVLLLDQRVDDVLLLDDPLPAGADQARVVRLFAAPAPGSAQSTAVVGPGDLVARIEDFLGQPRGTGAAVADHRADPAATEEASAALHAALADIRRSLRQG